MFCSLFLFFLNSFKFFFDCFFFDCFFSYFSLNNDLIHLNYFFSDFKLFNFSFVVNSCRRFFVRSSFYQEFFFSDLKSYFSFNCFSFFHGSGGFFVNTKPKFLFFWEKFILHSFVLLFSFFGFSFFYFKSMHDYLHLFIKFEKFLVTLIKSYFFFSWFFYKSSKNLISGYTEQFISFFFYFYHVFGTSSFFSFSKFFKLFFNYGKFNFVPYRLNFSVKSRRNSRSLFTNELFHLKSTVQSDFERFLTTNTFNPMYYFSYRKFYGKRNRNYKRR